MKNFWDDRYSQQDYVYGTSPNEFFRQEIEKLKPGRILLLGEGEGRNAVFAAKNGWQVDAFDYSAKARDKALKLAEDNNITINYNVVNIDELEIVPDTYDAAGIIFLHLHGILREKLHSLTLEALKTNGKLILEMFSKDQIKKTSGGPKELELLYSLSEIEKDFQDLKFEKFFETDTNLNEGSYHSGEASVIRLVGTKI